MYVDPILLATLLVLLVGTGGLAAVLYVKYRRCEDVYEAYGRARTAGKVQEPLPDPERYVTGADYAEIPVLDVSPLSWPAEQASEPHEQDTPAEVGGAARPDPYSPIQADVNAVSLGAQWAPPGYESGAPAEEVVEREAEPVASAPARWAVPEPAPEDTFFYEYTAQGFVPVDPHRPAPGALGSESCATAAPSAAVQEPDTGSVPITPTEAPVSTAPAAPPPSEPAVRSYERRAAEAAATPSEDGFVWL